MCPDRLKENGFGTFVLHKREYNPEVIPCTAGPGVSEFALQLVRSETRIEGILLQEDQSSF